MIQVIQVGPGIQVQVKVKIQENKKRCSVTYFNQLFIMMDT